jgi:ribulose-5-phosphate 4-epimerase/fuculose-1-phosphate aldolase
VLEGDEGTHIAQALGDKKAIILQNHGLLTAADTVEATIFWYVSLEKLCHVHLMALAAVGGDVSKIVEVEEKDAAEYVQAITIHQVRR